MKNFIRKSFNNLEYIKWAGTILCLFGILFTSYNIYPINIWLGFTGSALWTYAGFLQKDKPLIIVEGVAVALYFSGILHSVAR